MIRNILLPLDGSTFSEIARPLAQQLADASGAELHAITIAIDDDTPHPSEFVARQLTDYITTHGVDLVVMTTHGRTGIKRAVLGSVAEQIIRIARVPVLLAQKDAPAIHRMLIALDGSSESEAVLVPALELARLLQAKITLVRVATAPFDIVATIGTTALHEYLERVRAHAVEYLDNMANCLPEPVEVVALTSDRPAEGILRCQDDVGADLIVMSTHGRTGWSRIAVGSVAESVLHRSPVPVMLLRAPAANDQPSGGAAALEQTGV